MRSAVGEAKGAAATAGNTASGFGADASSISSMLQPFLTRELTAPQGYSQQDRTQMLNQAEAGAGGATSAIQGEAARMAARSRNPSGFTAALDEAARQRDKASAAASEGIASKDADLKQEQQQDAARGLAGMYGQDTDAMLKSMGLQTGDINAEVNANNSGWMQNFTKILEAVRGAGGSSGSGGGFTI